MNEARDTVLTPPQAADSMRFPLRLSTRGRYHVFNPEVRAATHRRITEAGAFSSCNPHTRASPMLRRP